MTKSERAIVAVLGGGPAGASAALELARLAIETVLIEQSDGSGSPVGECLAPSANPLLRQLGLEDVLRASGAVPSYGNRSSWGGDGAVADRGFLRDPFGHGWHLDRPAFNRALLDTVESAGVPVWRQNRVTAIERTTGSWQISTASPEGEGILHSSMLVDASGRRALMARREQLRRRTLDSQVAAVGFLDADAGAAPLPGHDHHHRGSPRTAGGTRRCSQPAARGSMVYRSRSARRACGLASGRLVESVAFSHLVGRLVAAHGYGIPQRIEVFAASSSLLTHPTGDGWIAAGDAAASYDPLSSHGIGSALACGRSAARAVAATLDGDTTAFTTYRDRLLADYTHYLCTRHAYYADERRWPTSPLWRRRHDNPQQRSA